MCQVEKLMLTKQEKGKQNGRRGISEKVNGETEADDRSDGEECGDRSAKPNDSPQIIGNMQQ